MQPELRRNRDETPTTVGTERKGHVPPMVSAPDDEIDPPVRNLARVLNEFPGVHTYTSCGGHADPANSTQAEEGCWYVDFHVDRSDDGWASLEHLAWMAYDFMPRDGGVELLALAKSPWNDPGQMLFFRWAGLDPDDPKATADAIAILLSVWKREAYLSAVEARDWRGA